MTVYRCDVRDFVPERKYGVILADPPWLWSTWSDKGRLKTPDAHYPCMTMDDMKALPVGDWAAPDCLLFMWAMDAMLPQALELMDAWGFQFTTVGFYWVKRTVNDKEFLGQGYWTRGNPEQCLLGKIGRPKRKSAAVRRLMTAKRGAHSEKPPETRTRIEELVDGPYLEIFSRHNTPGWDAVGNEAGTRDQAAEPSQTEGFVPTQEAIDEIAEIERRMAISAANAGKILVG